MPFIQLYYGPYESYGIIRHRPQRLHGLLKYLTLKNYEVEVVPTQHLDRLTVKICDTDVFQCGVTQLLFGIEAEQDKTCLKAIASIEEAIVRLYDEANIPKYVSVEKGMRFKAKEVKTAELFTSGITLMYEIQSQHKYHSQFGHHQLSFADNKSVQLSSHNSTIGTSTISEYSKDSSRAKSVDTPVSVSTTATDDLEEKPAILPTIRGSGTFSIDEDDINGAAEGAKDNESDSIIIKESPWEKLNNKQRSNGLPTFRALRENGALKAQRKMSELVCFLENPAQKPITESPLVCGPRRSTRNLEQSTEIIHDII